MWGKKLISRPFPIFLSLNCLPPLSYVRLKKIYKIQFILLIYIKLYWNEGRKERKRKLPFIRSVMHEFIRSLSHLPHIAVIEECSCSWALALAPITSLLQSSVNCSSSRYMMKYLLQTSVWGNSKIVLAYVCQWLLFLDLCFENTLFHWTWKTTLLKMNGINWHKSVKWMT